MVRALAPTRAAACRRPAALRRGLGRGMELPAWRARVLVRVRALPPRPRLGTSPWRLACGARPCFNAKTCRRFEGLIPAVPGILDFKRPVLLGEGGATIVRACRDAKGGETQTALRPGSVPRARRLVFGTGDRFAAVISWSVMYGFLFALNGGIMCSTVISLDQGLLCQKKKKNPLKFQNVNV